MRDGRIVSGCTVLGLLTGIVITWFVSVQSGTTLEMWKNDLFVNSSWQGWLVFAVTTVLPILVGLRTGLVRNDWSGILLTPVYAILASAVSLVVVAIILKLMEFFEVVSFLGLVGLIGLLLPTTVSIIIIISG